MAPLRELKRDRTRAALLDAAMRLFDAHGFDATTVAQIAAEAEVGTRTFFRYFASKEELVLPDGERRVQTALEAVATRRDGEPPARALLRALDIAGLTGPAEQDAFDALRLRIIRETPSAAGYALRAQHDAQLRIGAALHAAYPDDLDAVEAAALVGAFVGAFSSATAAVSDAGLSSAAARTAIRRAVAAVLSDGTPPIAET